jgi:hypothetical protein
VLGASSYTYAEASFTQTLPDWIGAHVRSGRVHPPDLALDTHRQPVRGGAQGNAGKGRAGHLADQCPLGYRNVTGPDGKKVIATDPAVAPLIVKLFEWYARGDISLKEAARKAHAAGLVYPKSGAKVPVSTIHNHPAQPALYRLV